MKKKSKGFTLIELLVVIAIIGILATIVLVSLNNARQKARDSRRVSDLRQIALALEMYFDDNSTYPGDTTAAGCDEFGPCTTVGTMCYQLQTQGQMTTVPNDPLGGSNTYSYEGWGTTTTSEYILKATLESCSATAGPCMTDVDGTVSGCTCADGTGTGPGSYCIQP